MIGESAGSKKLVAYQKTMPSANKWAASFD